MAGRILGVIGSVVSPNQTCAVPRQTISENLGLLRDLVDCVDGTSTTCHPFPRSREGIRSG